jgi:transcriptional regulator with XRE-family HTH domain
VTGKMLALSLAVSENTVSNWTTGTHRPRKRHVEALARELETSIDEFSDVPAMSPAAAAIEKAEGKGPSSPSADEIVSRLATIDIGRTSAALASLARQLESVQSDARLYADEKREGGTMRTAGAERDATC